MGFINLIVVSLVIFVAVSLLPGDFASALLEREATPETLEIIQQQLGLDRPWFERYVLWLWSALHGDFGASFSGRPVGAIIVPRLQNTLVLALSTAAITVPLALGLGIVAALFRNTVVDRALSSVSLAFISIPEFFFAYLTMLILAVQLGVFPSLSTLREGMGFGEHMYRLALPVITLTLYLLAHMMRNTRAAIIGVMSMPYIEMAELKGESRRRVVMRHALPNVIGPIANVIAINLAYLISGVVVVEIVFVYPGIGQTMVDAVRNRDIPVIQACAIIFSVTYIGLNIAADVVSIVSNPRLLFPR